MDKKSKYITIFMCIVTLSVPLILIFTPMIMTGSPECLLFYCQFVAGPMLVACQYVGITLPNLPGNIILLLVVLVLFFSQMLTTWMILIRLSKIRNCFVRWLSYCLILIAYRYLMLLAVDY